MPCDEAEDLLQLWRDMLSNDRQYKFDFRKVNKKRLNEEVVKVNEMIK